MNVQISDAGAALLQASQGPIVLTKYKLGSDYGYIPSPTDTDIHGTLIYEGVPSDATVVNANIVKYSIYLDYNIGPFQYGEFALFAGSVMFANGTASALIDKIAAGLTVGNSMRIDIYLSMVGTNYSMWFDLAESNNQFRVATLDSPDRLPPAAEATPNVYIIQGATSQQSPLLAYTDRVGLWNFDVYQYSTILDATVVGFTSQSITIAIADYSINMVPEYFGQLIIEFVTGSLYSICRYIRATVVSGNTATLSFDTPLAKLPLVGDKFQMFTRATVSIALQVPIATASVLGGIKIGQGLKITADGTCSVDPLAIGLVTSVNNMVGDVVLNAANLPGLSTVGKSGLYSDLIGAPAAYVLPAMSMATRGGAKLPANGNLIITGGDTLDLGFVPVKTVNTIGPDAQGNVTVTSTYTLPPATASVLGGVKQGTGVTIAADGTLSASGYTLPIASGGALGGIKVGQGLSIDAGGVLKTNLLTVNGQTPDGSGNIAVTVSPDATKLDRVIGVATGIRYALAALPNQGAGTLTISQAAGNVQNITFTGGAVTWAFTNWSGSGSVYSEVQMQITNGGLSNHTWPANMRFVNPDGTWTTSLATIMSNQRGTTNFQTNGTDFLIFWTFGSNILCKVM